MIIIYKPMFQYPHFWTLRGFKWLSKLVTPLYFNKFELRTCFDNHMARISTKFCVIDQFSKTTVFNNRTQLVFVFRRLFSPSLPNVQYFPFSEVTPWSDFLKYVDWPLTIISSNKWSNAPGKPSAKPLNSAKSTLLDSLVRMSL